MTLHLEAPNKRRTQWVKYATDALRAGFDRAIKLEFYGAKVSSDAGLFPSRDLDEPAQLTFLVSTSVVMGARIHL